MSAHCDRTSFKLTTDEGFTFVEVMVALAVLGIAITALVSFLVSNSLISARAADKSRVTDAMAQVADELRALPYAEAGKQTTYVASNGVTMHLKVTTSKENNTNLKIITITGTSPRLKPATTQTLEVILRSPAMATNDDGTNADDATISNPPVISSFYVLTTLGAYPPQSVLGRDVYTVRVTATTANPQAVLTGITVTCNGEPLPAVNTSLASGSAKDFTLMTSNLDASYNRLYKDGINRITIDVKDSEGGFVRKSYYYIIDIDPVLQTFDQTPISVFTNNGITIAWNPIDDGTNGSSTALRYYLVLEDTAEDGTLSTKTAYVAGDTPTTLPPTTYTFNVQYNPAHSYRVKVYAACPAGCVWHNFWPTVNHAPDGSTISSSYLTTSF